MTLNLTVPEQSHSDFSPRITVIGVGGGGTNAVDNMIASSLQGVEFVVANTDAQSLAKSRADRRIQLGPHLTHGLGAGAKPEVGRGAAEEAADEISKYLEGSHMVFITTGMGGGTGTGAAPVIARMARERNILTVGVVSKPFDYEGKRRARIADEGIRELQQYVDTLIVIPNQNLFRVASERTTLREAYRMADHVLYMGVRGVTDLMVAPGYINLDFADIRSVMAEMGKAMMGTGEAEGDNRAIEAAEAAIANPLLEDASMSGAQGLLVNITGGEDITLFEMEEAANRIRREVTDDANMIWGSIIDETMNGKIRVSVVATGIDMPELDRPQAAPGESSSAPPSGATPQNTGKEAVSQPEPAPQQVTRHETIPYPNQPASQPAAQHNAGQPYQQQPSRQTSHAAPPPAHSLPGQQQASMAPPPAAQQPLMRPGPSPRAGLFTETPRHAVPPTNTQPRSGLFGRMTNPFRRTNPNDQHTNEHNPQPQPHQSQHYPAQHEQAAHQGPAQQQAHTPQNTHQEQGQPGHQQGVSIRPADSDENGLEIPTFLRR
ncbi:cell division protein FtsZ [Acetobacter thailandicus]|uniref:cell division protein FtsZ n=1 Tax=Acetobacter thailandicus TaxID=1502842 RepID=UPI001BAA6F96|nr:cell division protein FtsZ [Acetobacter thailandicus]MBS0984918.1 cell division protein FtsZ [Acetobacter thailandicus]